MRAGHVAMIRNDDERVVLSYRSFASVTGIVAALVSGIVLVAGVAAALFLIAEGSPLRATVAFVLTAGFALLIRSLAPRVEVTLYDAASSPALTLSQRATFPVIHFVVALPDGTVVAELRKHFLARLGRNRWTILQRGHVVGTAAEESLARALVRKLLGKFSRSYETNVLIRLGNADAARVVRRPEEHGADLVEITSDTLDRRIAVAIATLIFGLEP